MASLAEQLQSTYEGFSAKAPPPAVETINTTKANFIATYDPKSAIQVGDTLPAFTLKDATGKEVSSKDLLSHGPLLISFYRGEWCPYCNLALRSLQVHLDQLQAKNVTLVAISPELPNTSLTTIEKNELKFPVLSDVGNKLAGQLGIVFQQPNELRPVFDQFGMDLKKRNGDDSFVVPVPAVLLVGKDGVVRNTFIDADYTKRLEPSVALGWIEKL